MLFFQHTVYGLLDLGRRLQRTITCLSRVALVIFLPIGALATIGAPASALAELSARACCARHHCPHRTTSPRCPGGKCCNIQADAGTAVLSAPPPSDHPTQALYWLSPQDAAESLWRAVWQVSASGHPPQVPIYLTNRTLRL